MNNQYKKKCISCGKEIEGDLIEEKKEMVEGKSMEIERFGQMTKTSIISFEYPIFCKKCLELDVFRRLSIYVDWLKK